MSRTVFETKAGSTQAGSGGAQAGGATFLERALERALSSLDRDVGLSDIERDAAKAALATALAGEIRDLLTAPRPVGGAARAPSAWLERPFAAQPGVERPGYFREPAAVVGIADGAGGEPVRLTGGAATWLRLSPAHDPGRTWTLGELRKAMRKGPGVLPIFADAAGTGELSAGDGVGVYATSPSATESSGVAFAFRSGELWSVDTYVQDALAQQRPNREIMTLEPQLVAAFASYVALLERLGVRGPYRWTVGMDGLLGRSIAFSEGEMAGLLRGDCVVNTVVTEGVWDGSGAVEDALAPFFEDLLRACSTPVG